jgi:serine/threonine protein kinase
MGAQSEQDSARSKAKERVGSMVRAKWHLDKIIGYGGMAAVYAATHEDGRINALKIMHPELCHDDDIRERFLREGHIARQVEHDGVVRIFDDDVTERGEPFLVMELLKGSPLSRVWRKRNKRLPVGSSLHIGAAVLDALAAFHEKEIVHRDLKPANIFITRESVVKVLDFGVARLREKGRDMTRAGLAMGTPSFMAPEQALGKNKSVDHRADIYALGATLYTIISGRKLHRGTSEQESYVLAATQPAPSVARAAPDLPVEVVTIIDKALQWDPRNRYQSAEEMHAAIMAVLSSGRDLSQPVGGVDDEDSSAGMNLDLDSGARHSIPTAATQVAKVPRRQDRTTGSGIEIELEFEPARARAGPPRPAGITGIKRSTVARPGAVRPEVASRGPTPSTTGTRVAAAKSDDVPLAPDHPLAGLFVALDRLLRTARQYGPSHPETQNRLPAVLQGTASALERQPEGLTVKVMPFCFAHEGETVWEPSPPGDIVPYTLSVAGLREFHIVEGVGEEELRELFGAMMIDANSNPSEIATTLWEAPFQHIQCKIEEDLGGEDAESLEDFFAEAAVLEKELSTQLSDVQKMALSMQREDVMEAAALAAMTKAAERSANMLALDAEAHERLSAATKLRTSELRKRHDEVLLDAFGDAALRRDMTALLEAVGAYARRQVRLGRDDDVYSTHRVLVDKLQKSKRPSRLSPAFITATLFPADVLSHVVRTASGFSALLTAEQRDKALAGFELITKTTSANSLPTFLDLAERVQEGPLFALLLDYVARTAEGDENQVLQRLEKLSPLVAQAIMKRLLENGGDRIKPLLQPLLQSENTALRCEAIAHLATSDIQLTQELMKLFKSPDQGVRWAALDTFVRHSVLSAGPALVAVVEDKSFRTRAFDEQERVFDALVALNPTRTETLLTSLIASHGIMRNDELERTRTLAARVLGEHAKTKEALAAVKKATGRGWWNSPELREVAVLAANQIEARIAAGGAA